MADELSARIISGPTLAAVKKVRREVTKANVSAVRAAGAALQAEARRRAPVYDGPRKDVPKGRLKKAIKAGRVVRNGDTSATVKVGPRGAVVHLYAGKIEAEQPYMSAAYAEVGGALAEIAAAEYAKAIAKAGL